VKYIFVVVTLILQWHVQRGQRLCK
jgi:hypothetical protein